MATFIVPTEWDIIIKFYGDRVAKRSGVPLINHIWDGFDILCALKAPDIAKNAYAIHPLVQNNEGPDCSHFESYELACEYRDKANSYLCRPENDWVYHPDNLLWMVGKMSANCRLMLLADKIQNQKDFLIYNSDHPRARELTEYFFNWLNYLRDEKFCVNGTSCV